MDTPEGKHLQRHWLMRILLSKAFLFSVALMITYTLAGFFLAPYLIKRQSTQFAQESLKCLVVMDEVRVNPYALTLELKGLGDLEPILAMETIRLEDGRFVLASPSFQMGFLAENLKILFEGLSLKEVGQEPPLVTLERLSVEKGGIDLKTRQVTLERIMMEDGHAAMVLEKAGAVNLMRVLERRNVDKLREKVAVAVDKAQAEGRPWSVAVGSVEATGLSVALRDQTLSPEPAVNLQDITLKIADLHSKGKASAPFETSLTIREGGNHECQGKLHSRPEKCGSDCPCVEPGPDAFSLLLDTIHLPERGWG